jgi:hypothetical protein
MQAGNQIGSIVDKVLRNPRRVKTPTSLPEDFLLLDDDQKWISGRR